VVAPATTPLLLLHGLAGQLLRSAQRECARGGGTSPDPHRGGGCDFLVIRDGGLPATRLADWRASQTRRGAANAPELRLFGAPYTWPELDGLLAGTQELVRARLPRGDVHALQATLTAGEAASAVDYLYYRARAPEPVRRALARLDEAWASRGATPDVAPPWRWLPAAPDGGERREAILADVLAIYDFCAAELPREDSNGAG
jgi:hypothetical protein